MDVLPMVSQSQHSGILTYPTLQLSHPLSPVTGPAQFCLQNATEKEQNETQLTTMVHGDQSSLTLTLAFAIWSPVKGMGLITNGVTVTTLRFTDISNFTAITSCFTYHGVSTVLLAECYRKGNSIEDT